MQGDHKKLIREMGAASNVLLKNSGVLPLDTKKVKSIALVGSDIKNGASAVNNATSCADHGCSDGHLAQGWVSNQTKSQRMSNVSNLLAFTRDLVLLISPI